MCPPLFCVVIVGKDRLGHLFAPSQNSGNRIPIAAWVLAIFIAAWCNYFLGFRAHSRSALLFLVLPIALSISIFLIAEIDSSPRSAVIRVHAVNLQSLADSLHTTNGVD
jgi:hypothetical protein